MVPDGSSPGPRPWLDVCSYITTRTLEWGANKSTLIVLRVRTFVNVLFGSILAHCKHNNHKGELV